MDGADLEDPPPSPAAAAVNWWQVLAADGAVGVGALLGGTAMVFLAGWIVVGAGVASLGLAYAMAVWRRRGRWLEWRRRNGLS